MSLVFGGVFSSANAETDIGVPAPMSLSYAVVPAPWDPARAYAPGDQASWYPTFGGGAYNNNPLYVCVAANTNSPPGPGNPAWAAGAAVAPIPITVGGQLNCGLQTVTTAAGATVAQGWFQTDPFVPAGAAGPCYVEIRAYVAPGASGTFAVNYGQAFASGSYLNLGTSGVADLTAAGYGAIGHAVGQSIRPLLALGVPAIRDDPRAVAIISDSIGTGQLGQGVVGGGFTVASGGSGFTASDVGRVLLMGRAGATAGAVGADARFVIMGVSAGAVTTVRLAASGSYTNPATNTTQTLPSGTQTLTNPAVNPPVGSGVQLSGVTFSSTSMHPGDATYAHSFVQCALSQAGMRWAAFTSPGDGICNWQARDYGRLAYLGKSGCTSAIIAIGINDITGGRTAAQMQAAYLQLAAQLKGAGFAGAYLTTMMPAATSTDGFATLAGQTPTGDAVRQAVNAWARTVPAPFDGCIDVAAAMESGTSGKWVVNGTPGYATIDGKHPTESGHAIAQAVIAAAIPSLR
jgi:lysophospholipase L1-like esterase